MPILIPEHSFSPDFPTSVWYIEHNLGFIPNIISDATYPWKDTPEPTVFDTLSTILPTHVSVLEEQPVSDGTRVSFSGLLNNPGIYVYVGNQGIFVPEPAADSIQNTVQATKISVQHPDVYTTIIYWSKPTWGTIGLGKVAYDSPIPIVNVGAVVLGPEGGSVTIGQLNYTILYERIINELGTIRQQLEMLAKPSDSPTALPKTLTFYGLLRTNRIQNIKNLMKKLPDFLKGPSEGGNG